MKNLLKICLALFLFSLGSTLMAQNQNPQESEILNKAQNDLSVLKDAVDLSEAAESRILEVLIEKNRFMEMENLSTGRRNVTVKDGFMDHIKSILIATDSVNGASKFNQLRNNHELLEQLNLNLVSEN